MRLLIQRVSDASVTVSKEVVGAIEKGLCVLIGVHEEDTENKIDWLVDKLINLRIFEDENGKMNRSLLDESADILLISQFTLYADCQNGRRPSFINSAKPDKARKIYDAFIARLSVALKGTSSTFKTGKFGEFMSVKLTNDGPTTIILER